MDRLEGPRNSEVSHKLNFFLNVVRFKGAPCCSDPRQPTKPWGPMQALGGNCRTTLLVAASSCAQHAAKALEGTWAKFVFWTGASCKLCILWVAKPLQRTLEAQRGIHIKFIPLITRPSNYHPANLCSCSASAPRMKLFLLYVLPPEQRVHGPEMLEKHGS